MSQYVDPYDTPKPTMPPPAYPGSNTGGYPVAGHPGQNFVVMQETNIDVMVVRPQQAQQPIYVTQVNQQNTQHSDDCLGFCCGCCAALVFCTVM